MQNIDFQNHHTHDILPTLQIAVSGHGHQDSKLIKSPEVITISRQGREVLVFSLPCLVELRVLLPTFLVFVVNHHHSENT
jgi:hypothetical protein